jgi:hypothetical protein
VRRKKPYSKRTELERVCSNWTKTVGLLSRGEYSVAIVRAGTTLELATNLAIRAEFKPTKLSPKFVDSLLLWANGLSGKYRKLLLPIVDGKTRHTVFRALANDLDAVNTQRNSVAHRGEFRGHKTAEKIVTVARRLIEQLVGEYHNGFSLPVVATFNPCLQRPTPRAARRRR